MGKPQDTFGTGAWYDTVAFVGQDAAPEDLGNLDPGDTHTEQVYVSPSLVRDSEGIVAISTDDRSLGLDTSVELVTPGGSFEVTLEQFEFAPDVGDTFDLLLQSGASPASLSVPFQAERRSVFPHIPQSGVRETIEFLTDVQESWDGTEQRTRMRPLPRITLACEYLLPAASEEELQRMKIRMAGFLGHKIYVPMWQLQGLITSRISIGGTPDVRISCEHPSFDRHRADKLFFYNPETGESDIISYTSAPVDESGSFDIGSVEAGTVAVEGAYCMPVFRAVMQDNPQFEVMPSGALSAKVTWLIDQPVSALQTDGAEYADLYSGIAFDGITRPLMDDARLISRGGGSSSFLKDFELRDEKTGVLTTINRVDVSRPQMSKTFEVYNDPVLANDVRKFLLWTWGRQRAFMVPTQTNDLEIADDYVSGQLLRFKIQGYGYEVLSGVGVSGQDYFGMFEIEMQDGTIFRSSAPISTNDYDADVFVCTAPGFASMDTVAQGPIVRISFMPRMRLASDRISLVHKNNGSLTAQTNLVATEQ